MISPHRIAPVLKKELLQLRRDRLTFSIIIMIQLRLFGDAFKSNLRHVRVGLVDKSRTELSRKFSQIVQATQVVTITEELTTRKKPSVRSPSPACVPRWSSLRTRANVLPAARLSGLVFPTLRT